MGISNITCPKTAILSITSKLTLPHFCFSLYYAIFVSKIYPRPSSTALTLVKTIIISCPNWYNFTLTWSWFHSCLLICSSQTQNTSVAPYNILNKTHVELFSALFPCWSLNSGSSPTSFLALKHLICSLLYLECTPSWCFALSVSFSSHFNFKNRSFPT